jgi:branched-subunit amino acid transport protein
VAILVTVRTRSVIAAMASGMAALWLLQWAVGAT